MRIIKLALALSTMLCLAATSTLARESGSTRSSTTKSKTSRQSKTSRTKSATAKRKASAATRRAAAKKKATSSKSKQVAQARNTGEIDVRGTHWDDLPPEELPVNEQEVIDDEDLLPEP